MTAVLSFQRETYESNFEGFVWSEQFVDEYEQALKLASNSPAEGLLVAEAADGTLVGFVWVGVALRSHNRDRIVGIIKNMYVEPGWRRAGIGGRLLDEAERFARARSATKMLLEATATNVAAIRLYERAGYAVERYEMAKRLR